jgi:hypothetical protein
VQIADGSVERPAVKLPDLSQDNTAQTTVEEPEWATQPTKKATAPILPRALSDITPTGDREVTTSIALGKQKSDFDERQKTPLPLPPPEDVTNVKRAPVRTRVSGSFQATVAPPIEQLPVVAVRPLTAQTAPLGGAFAERELASKQRSSAFVITAVSMLLAGVVFGGFAWWWQQRNAEVAAAEKAVTVPPAAAPPAPAAAAAPPPPAAAPPQPVAAPPAGKSWACPKDMVLVELRSIRFCIDRDEEQQKSGAPHAGVPFEYAAEACKLVGKRLCEAKEWELACRGENLSSYPWGGKPLPDKPCNLGPDRQIDSVGTHERCVSASGARDMAGNVAEWDAEGQLRGGSAMSTGDGRCSRPMLKKEGRTLEDVGYRCCADLSAAP